MIILRRLVLHILALIVDFVMMCFLCPFSPLFLFIIVPWIFISPNSKEDDIFRDSHLWSERLRKEAAKYD